MISDGFSKTTPVISKGANKGGGCWARGRCSHAQQRSSCRSRNGKPRRGGTHPRRRRCQTKMRAWAGLTGVGGHDRTVYEYICISPQNQTQHSLIAGSCPRCPGTSNGTAVPGRDATRREGRRRAQTHRRRRSVDPTRTRTGASARAGRASHQDRATSAVGPDWS